MSINEQSESGHRTAGRVLDILETFQRIGKPLSLTELADIAGIPKSSCHAIVATLTAPWQIAHCGLEAGIPPFMVDKGWQVLDSHEASFTAAVAAGVNIAMGTDQGTPVNKPGENAQEVLRMVRLGMSPSAALMASTAWAADLLQVSDQAIRNVNRRMRQPPESRRKADARLRNTIAIQQRGCVLLANLERAPLCNAQTKSCITDRARDPDIILGTGP